MVDHPSNLDAHRGMAAQKATDLRRLRAEVAADQEALRARQTALEDMLAAAPATDWPEAVEKARYLLGLFAQSADATDPRRRKLIDQVMADFEHLLDRAATTAPIFHKLTGKGDKRWPRESDVETAKQRSRKRRNRRLP